MNSDVIKEIANQLGIAADQAGQYLGDLAPQWAAMKIAQCSVGVGIGALLLIAAVACGVLAARFGISAATGKPWESGIYDRADVACGFGFAAAALGIVALIVLAFGLPKLLGYVVAPDAAFASDLLGMVGK